MIDNDLLLIPIHLGNHWALCAVDFRLKKVAYIDSLLRPNSNVTSVILNFLAEVHLFETESVLSADEWSESVQTDAPQQNNGFDCGVYLCINANLLSIDSPLCYTCSDILEFRKMMHL